MSRYIASIRTCNQVGPDSFHEVLQTRIVKTDDTVEQLMQWARVQAGTPRRPARNPQLLITPDLADESEKGG